MRFKIESDIGGFLWWVLIRFCKTDLKEEQSRDQWSRNIFFLMLLVLIVGATFIKFF
ncbi:MAG: hypothetical protein ACK4RM_11350 [Flavobacterium sp.]